MLNANSGKKQVKAQESVYPWQDQFWWDNGSSEHQTGLRGLQWGKKRHSEGDSASGFNSGEGETGINRWGV